MFCGVVPWGIKAFALIMGRDVESLGPVFVMVSEVYLDGTHRLSMRGFRWIVSD